MKTNRTASINSSSDKEPDINSLKKLSQQALADYAITLIEENQKMELVSNATLTKYETLLSVYPNPVIIIDKKGYVSEINQAVVESSGFSRDKILNKHFLKLPFFRLQDLPKYTLLMHRILKGELTVVEDIRWKHKSGEIRYSNAYCKLFYDNKGKTAGFIGVVPDITDTKTSELIKKKTEDEYYDLIEKTQIALLTDDEQGRITSVNARFLNLFEFTEEDIKDFNLSQWVHPEDYPLVLKNHTNRLAGKKALKNYEFRALTKSGKIIWCEVEVISLVENGRNKGSRTYLRDISKRKADKQKIEEQSQLLQSAIENLTDPFYVIDVKDYSIQLANTASGLKKGQIKTKCYELVHNRTTPCEGETQTCTLSQIMKTRKPCTLEHRHYNANGELRHVEIRAYPIFDNKQNITRVIEHTLDITDKKKINEALIREKTQTQAYLDIAAVMLVVLDTAQKVVLCNKEGLKILGFSESELIGKNWFDMVIPERERPMVKQVFDAFVGEKQDAPEYFENYIITKKGEKRLIAWKNSFVRNKEGKIENLISSGRILPGNANPKKN